MPWTRCTPACCRFFAMMLVLIVLLMLFPQIAVWLPTTMMGR
jgi:TRAP-type C4-dicarboxylate transport system permease large subunit